MKGYDTYAGFMGYVDGEYMLFASDEEYYEYMEEEQRDILRDYFTRPCHFALRQRARFGEFL